MPLAEDGLVGLQLSARPDILLRVSGTAMKRKATPKAQSVRARRRVKRVVPHARRAPTETREGDFIDSLIAATAQALGLTIDPAWCDSVKLNLRVVLDHAARVEEFPLADDAEPAPVFHA
jgi:hypothetical protein